MKKKTKKYLRNFGIAYLFAILGLTFKYCRNDKNVTSINVINPLEK